MQSVSIALCTFNGARFLEQQLDSYRAQTELPAELVLCDDRSTDDTVAIARRFAADAPFPVRIEVNEARLGVAANFSRAIGLCSGDFVALSDQDDVWLPHKLQRIQQIFASRPGIAMVFSDAECTDEHDADLGYRLWDAVLFTRSERRKAATGRLLEVVLRHPVVTGATLAFRSSYRDLVLPIPPLCQHDQWIAVLTSSVGEGYAIADSLIRYRQHATQTSGGERLVSFLDQARKSRLQTPDSLEHLADQFETARKRLESAHAYRAPAGAVRHLEAKVAHVRARARIRRPDTFGLPLVLRELLSARYFKYSYAWRGVAADLFLRPR